LTETHCVISGQTLGVTPSPHSFHLPGPFSRVTPFPQKLTFGNCCNKSHLQARFRSCHLINSIKILSKYKVHAVMVNQGDCCGSTF